MEEIWKPVKGYEGLYEVSNLGNVRSLGSVTTYLRNGQVINLPHKPKLMKPQIRQHGYLSVCLYGRAPAGKRFVQYSVHRLVADAFCEKCDGCNEVNHINEDKTDNRAINLEWVSHIKNCNHGTAKLRRAAKQTDRVTVPIMQIDKQGNVINIFPNVYSAERATGISHGNIYNSIYKKHFGNGYMWRKVTEISE